jgi:putative transposase
MNIGHHNYNVESLYKIAGFTRQAHYAYLKRREAFDLQYRLVEDTIGNIRQKHSQMGLRKIWYLVKPDWIGRDIFIAIGVDLGLEIPKPKNYQRTTFSTRCNLYDNLTIDLLINDINQVWVSDITYIFIDNTFYYLTFIEDVYSRRILGWSASRTLQATASCTALKRALKTRSGMDLSNLIHHSDKGTQYTSNQYLNILNKYNTAVSLCNSVYENAHIERFNGIIKHEYLLPAKIKNFSHLLTEVKKSVEYYNNSRPHYSLNLSTPVEFENKLSQIPVAERQPLIMWSENKNKRPVQYSIFN